MVCGVKDINAFISGCGVCYTPESPDGPDDCYTRDDFIDLCGGDVLKARIVFDLCEWQHPETILAEWDEDDDEELAAMHMKHT